MASSGQSVLAIEEHSDVTSSANLERLPNLLRQFNDCVRLFQKTGYGSGGKSLSRFFLGIAAADQDFQSRIPLF